MATQDNTARGLNWRGIFAIAITSIAHLVVFGVMLMPTKVPEPARKPPIVDVGPQDWERLPPPKLIEKPVQKPVAAIAAPKVAQARVAQPAAAAEPEILVAAPAGEPTVEQVVATEVAVADDVSEAQVAARYGEKAQIEYPSVLRKRRVEGNVLVRVLVGEDGRVVSVEIAKPSRHAAFDREALRSVAKFKFNPKKVNGMAKRGYVLVPVNFRLDI